METTCLDTETVDTSELYAVAPSISESEHQKLMSMAMPGLVDLHCDIPTQACTASQVSAVMPPTAEKPAHGGRRSREPKEQANTKTQELSKKLVKALTDKIMKRMNRKDQQPPDQNTELAVAVSNLSNESSSTSLQSLEENLSTEVAVLKNMCVEQNHESILENLPVNLPIIEAGNLDGSPVPMATYSSTHDTSSAPHTVTTSTLHTSPTPHISPNLHTSSTFHTSPTFHNSSSSMSLDTSVATVNNCAQTQSVNIPQRTESADITRRTSPQLHRTIDNLQAHVPTCETKHAQYMRHNSVPITNQNDYQTSAPNSITNAFAGGNGAPPMYYYPDANNGQFNTYTSPVRPAAVGNSDRDIMLERYIQQQTPYLQEHPGYRGHTKDTYSLKSPDSGYCEPCVSPQDQCYVVSFLF